VLTLVQMGDGGYSQAFTWANYWFRNKTVYFGDWVVVGNTTLSSYFAAASRAVDELAKKWQASDKQYKPQAYPQISQALMEISRAIAGTDIDKPLGRGYALMTDIIWKAYLARAATLGVASGITTGVTAYIVYRDVWKAARCGLYAAGITFVSSFTAPFFSGMSVAGKIGIVAGPLGILVC